ncbi:transcriptional regulator [Photorhabdus laumondii subsp. laumondii]|uniref:Photorhabdus luminescens subsp. laumondii TTO1 complete genome segment 4/17 n=4 Tax=Photorhabdus TaxID=29487 RepID=Q7N805_PHOLL|nr:MULTISPECIES: helix-turn-helix transcriptional regulator [Photorhabdus]PQQ37005.1 transcriptional regulator [Photorhabdus luminescens]AWK40870.1 transcriptional regulator [Photorhabdus laumondii subsp. laumondii]AXG41677.1 transcriptional regulator [Photorhabdus laumondii subsp. laumondii]AXG46206.1 transcriptional regulator [Photorhabdus laumondii subsp. laumondii]KTL60398.1 transcriptional regulator [Photorhabdus laumondii subsp. laumondii]
MDIQDWHPADIIAALRKQGTNLSAVSRKAGLASSTLSNALHRPWPKGEALIATELGLHPSDIWPSRYKPGKENKFLIRIAETSTIESW